MFWIFPWRAGPCFTFTGSLSSSTWIFLGRRTVSLTDSSSLRAASFAYPEITAAWTAAPNAIDSSGLILL